VAITTARKGLQIPLGFRLGSAASPFVFWPTDPVTGKTLTAAATPTITIYGSDGTTEKLAAANMTDASDGSWIYWATFATTATFPAGTGYQARFRYTATINSSSRALEAPRQLFGIYAEPAQSMVTDQDLTAEIADLNDLLGDRTDHSDVIQEAWNYTFRRLAEQKDPAASANLDPYTLRSVDIYPLHLCESLRRVCVELRNQEGDRWDLRATEAREEFDRSMVALMASLIDRFEAGPTIEAGVNPRKIRSHVLEYGDTDTTSTTNRGATTPAYTNLTRW